MIQQVSKTEAQNCAENKISDFRSALGPFVTAAEATRMPMIFTDAQNIAHPIVFVNQAFLDLTGYQEDEVLGQAFFVFMENGTDPEMIREIRTAFRGGRDLESRVNYRGKDKRDIWVTTNIAPVRDTYGNVVQYFASFIDITDSKREEDRLRLTIQDLTDKLDSKDYR